MKYTVDACVLKASGASGDQTAVACRNALLALMDVRPEILFCDELKVEWDRHKSRFGSQWLARMMSRGLLIKVRSGGMHLNGIIRAVNELPEQDIPAAKKDIHLVAVAVQFESVVVSLEVNCRKKYHRIAPLYPPLGYVIWGNPLRHGANLIAFIRGDYVAPDFWQLRCADE